MHQAEASIWWHDCIQGDDYDKLLVGLYPLERLREPGWLPAYPDSIIWEFRRYPGTNKWKIVPYKPEDFE